MEEKSNRETGEELIKMKVRNFVSLIISLIVVTNSFSIIYQKVLRNEENDAYNRERAERYADRKKNEAVLEIEMIMLKQELKDCQDSK